MSTSRKTAFTLELTAREVQLLLRYAYPFPEQAEQLRATRARAGDGLHVVRVAAFDANMWMADLVRSARQIRSAAVLEELDALCSALKQGIRATDGGA